MMNILMINLPFAGHTNPTLALAKALVIKGHKVFYINAKEFQKKIEDTGAIFIQYKSYPEKPSEKQKKTMCFRAAFDTAVLYEQKFDLLIYEMFFYPGIEIARRLGIPCVRQFSTSAWNEETKNQATLIFKISCKLIDMQMIGKKNMKYMKLEHKNFQTAVIYDKPDLNLVYVPQIFQKDRDSYTGNYLFTIPPFQPVESKQDIPYEKMKNPIIYISLGSIISNKGFCKECIRAFKGKDVSVILNTGKIDPKTIGKIPDNIYAYSFVPQIEVLKHADLFITHCGMNSINEAMVHGVPMVAMPFVNDQISNAIRVVELGIGKRIRSFPSSSKEMYKTSKLVLESKRIKKNCQDLQKSLQGELSIDEVVEEIEGIVNIKNCN